MKKFVKVIIPVCAVVVLIISCINLGSIFLEYNRGVQEYKELQEYVNNERPQLPAQEKEEDDFVMPEIDFAALKAKNEDFRYWLYIPALEVNYPVVQGKDNDIYLHRTFDGDSNSAGCIFLDAGNSPDLTDRNTVIYGHNMKNHSMFGSLKKFMQEEELAEENPYFYLYTEGEAIRYRIISYYMTVSGSDTYQSVYTDEDYDSYLKMALQKSLFKGYQKDYTEGQPDMVTLSTCHGKAGGTGRFVVHGVVDEIREWNES